MAISRNRNKRLPRVSTYVIRHNYTQGSQGNWTNGSIVIPVKAGDVITVYIKASGTGQFTRNLIGDSGHYYYNDGPNISAYENGATFMESEVISGDTTVTMSSYANSAITVDTAVITKTSW